MADAPAHVDVIKIENPPRGDMSLKEWLQAVKVNAGDADIVYVEPDFILFNAFEVMQEYRLVSVPIWDPRKRDCTGQVEMFDLVKAATEACSGGKLEAMDASNEAFQTTCGELIADSSNHKFATIAPGSSMWDCIKLLTDKRCRRLFLMEEGACVGILSDSWITRWLSVQGNIDNDTSKTVADLGLGWIGRAGIDTIDAKATALDAFRIMSEKGINAIGINGENGELLGCLCVTDLKAAVEGMEISRELLELPVMEFRARSHRVALWSRRGEFGRLEPRTVGKNLIDMDMLKQAFDDMDLDHNGSIDAAELTVVLEKAGEPCSPDIVKELIASVDEDDNGMIEFNEFLTLAQKIRSGDIKGLQDRFREGFEELVTVKSDDHFRHLVCILASSRVHQAFVIDDRHAAVRMLSSSDVLQGVVKLALGLV